MSTKEHQEKMVEELKAIRELLTPKPAAAPAAPVKKTFGQEFMDFLNKYGVIGLAIAFIIGGAAGRLVTALVSDLLMPIIGVVVPNGDWRTTVTQVGPIKFLLGDFLGTLVDFIVIALIVFMLMKQISKTGLK
ncbi:MAG: MscL family protein [Candidatus Bathyarchaeota archaeon]|nr:MscL family protein [Candidatus Bathyarchaeota archaeon]